MCGDIIFVYHSESRCRYGIRQWCAKSRYPSVVRKINHFNFKALIFWKKANVPLGFENLWPVTFNKMFKKGALRLN
jgi:hypothetical protein